MPQKRNSFLDLSMIKEHEIVDLEISPIEAFTLGDFSKSSEGFISASRSWTVFEFIAARLAERIFSLWIAEVLVLDPRSIVFAHKI